MSDRTTIPAMANAHSHAFQRDLRGVGERPAPDAHAPTTSGPGATAMFRLAGALDPESMRDVAGARLRARWPPPGYGAVGEFHYVHHQPDGTPYDEPNAMAIAVAEAARRRRAWRSSLLPAAYHRDGLGPDRRRPGQRRFCDPDVEAAPGARRRAARVGGGPRRRLASASPRTASARSRRRGWRRSRATPTTTASSATSTRTSSARELERVRAPSTACTPIELLRRTGFLGAADERRPRHPRDRRRRRPRSPRRDTIVVSCPTTEGNLGDGHLPALRYRDAGVRLAIGSRLAGARRPVRGGARAGDAGARRERAHPPRAARRTTATCGRELAANGRASLGLDDGRHASPSTSTTRDLRRRRDRRPAARARHLRRRPRSSRAASPAGRGAVRGTPARRRCRSARAPSR